MENKQENYCQERGRVCIACHFYVEMKFVITDPTQHLGVREQKNSLLTESMLGKTVQPQQPGGVCSQARWV